MAESNELPVKKKGITKAGITINFEPSDNNVEPFNLTLNLIKPKDDGSLNLDDDNSFTTAGRLLFRFGKKGSIELFAENTKQINLESTEDEEEYI